MKTLNLAAKLASFTQREGRRRIRRFGNRTFCVAAGFVLCAAPAVGQTPCTYDLCALRLELGSRAPYIVRGVEGERVATLQLFGSDLAGAFVGSDSALVRVARFERLQKTEAVVGLVSTVAWIAAFAVYDPDDRWTGIGLGAGGFLLSLAAAGVHRRAWNDLHAAVWWYNRELELLDDPGAPR